MPRSISASKKTSIVESDDLHIAGRFDIVAVNRDTLNLTLTSLWILVIESKTLKPLSTSASRKCSPMHTIVLPSNLPSGASSPIALPTSFSISAKTNTNTCPALASENAIAPSDCSKFSAPFVLGFQRSTKQSLLNNKARITALSGLPASGIVVQILQRNPIEHRLHLLVEPIPYRKRHPILRLTVRSSLMW